MSTEQTKTPRCLDIQPCELGGGYHLLQPGETIKAGDEYLNNKRWHPVTVHGERVEEFFLPRRRFVCNHGEGYRWLKSGETIQKSDEFFRLGLWTAFTSKVGTFVEPWMIARRPLARTNAEGAPEYRPIFTGEVLQEGDEFKSSTGYWVSFTSISFGKAWGGGGEARRRANGSRTYAEGITGDVGGIGCVGVQQAMPEYLSLRAQLCIWLDTQEITSENIGEIRRACFVPWASSWNAIVKDETAARENRLSMPPPVSLRML